MRTSPPKRPEEARIVHAPHSPPRCDRRRPESGLRASRIGRVLREVPVPYPTDDERDRPWVIRTYAGHSSAATKSNELYRRNLAKGQTGLSVAFDLPTQTGYDPDDELAKGEVGKVGVPVSHIGDMRTLFDGIPLAEANTSMTINAPAMWLLALYVAVADEHGRRRAHARRHHAERHRQGVPLAGHVRVPARAEHAPDHRHDRLVGGRTSRSGTRSTSAATTCRRPGPRRRRSWPTRCPPRSRCSTRCATPARCPPEEFGDVVARISFFVNAGLRFVEEMCKMRALARLWDEITRERYGVAGPASSAGCATACRSTRWASPRRSRRTTSSASCWRCSPSRSPATPAPARCSCRPGTRRWACRGRGTSSGRCACSRCWPTRPTCWSTRTSSTAAAWSRRRSPSSSRAPGPRSTGCRRWAARSRPSSPAT